MLVIEECKNSKAVTILLRGGTKMVSQFWMSIHNICFYFCPSTHYFYNSVKIFVHYFYPASYNI
jgi:hypothetical protein